MSTTFQLSDKRGDAIILVKAEDPDPGVAYQAFRVAAEDAGLNGVVESFGQGATAQAIAAATAITQPPPSPYRPAAPQQYAPAPQVPAAAGRACHHGPMTRREGDNARGHWVGWFCPSPKGTPDQCKAQFQ